MLTLWGNCDVTSGFGSHGGYVFSIVTTFQTWAYHVTSVDNLSKNFISPDTNMSLIHAHWFKSY